MIHNKAKKIILVCMILTFLSSLCGCTSLELDINIFSDIEECQNIKTLKADYADVQIYDSPIKDKKVNNLKYQDYFGCKYTSDDMTFELFAYEFSNSDIAMEYFKNVTGKKNDPNPTFSDSSGIFSYRRIVVNGNMAYSVSCSNSHKEKVIDFLNNCFSIDVFKVP